RTGIKLLHVPYRGGTALVNGLLTGEIQAGWSGLPNVVPHIAAGKLRALCVSVLERATSLPDVPTCHEVGIKGFDIADMLGLQGPAGMSPKTVERLQSAIAKIMREPAMAERMKVLGMGMQENGTANYVQFMKDDLDRYGKVIGRLGLKRKLSWRYSITSSARAIRLGGTVRPIAFAVFRLITISYFDACSTGSSSGLAPFRILSM